MLFPKKIELVFLTKTNNELKINQKIKKLRNRKYAIKNKEDTIDIKKYISNQINFEKSILNERIY
jgi:hypothetical protein